MAAIWVAIFHAKQCAFFPQTPQWLESIINAGYAGVDIFFVISGAIMAHSSTNSTHGPKTAAQFLLTRFSRIYTGWWPAMLMYFLFFNITQQTSPQTDLAASLLLYPAPLPSLIIVVIWSLTFELYFYAIISLGLLAPPKKRSILLKSWVLLIFLANILLLYYRQKSDKSTPIDWLEIIYVAPITLEFFMGYFLYRFISKNPNLKWPAWGGVLIISCSAIFYFSNHFADRDHGLAGYYYWPERTILIGLASTAAVGLALTIASPKTKLIFILSRLGNYSYAIYLLHILVFNLSSIFLQWINKTQDRQPVIILAVFTLLIALSAIYHRCVEQPLYLFFRRKISRCLGQTSQ